MVFNIEGTEGRAQRAQRKADPSLSLPAAGRFGMTSYKMVRVFGALQGDTGAKNELHGGEGESEGRSG